MRKINAIESYEFRNGTRYKTLTDMDTGEVLSCVKEKEIETVPKKKHFDSETYKYGSRLHFIKLYRTNILDLISRKKLSMAESGVFFVCMSLIGWETNFLINPNTNKNLGFNELVEMTGFNRQVLNDTLQSLNEKGLISIVKRGKGCSNHYQMNSNIAFWGKKIKDLNEHAVFSNECAHKPKIEIDYKEREGKDNK